MRRGGESSQAIAGGKGAPLMDSRLPLYEQVTEICRQRIVDGTWGPGDILPPEINIAREFQVAQGTVRRALDSLTREGLIERRQGLGTFVRRPRMASALSRFFRLADEEGRPISPEGRILGRRIVTIPAEAAAALGTPRNAKGIRLDRERVVAGRVELTEDIILPLPRFKALVDLPIEAFGDLLYPLFEEKARVTVARAEEEITVTAAPEGVAARLGLKPGAPVVSISRVAFSLDGTPVEWRQTHGDASRFRYKVEIR